jgi:Na+/melibiose symporter-like transporter
MTIATLGGFCIGLLVTYINPFMQDERYGNLQGKVGFVYGSMSVLAVIWVQFFLPELKERSLEEIDELFEKNVSTKRFRSYQAKSWEPHFRQTEPSKAVV